LFPVKLIVTVLPLLSTVTVQLAEFPLNDPKPEKKDESVEPGFKLP
jgi:hypothetical protein